MDASCAQTTAWPVTASPPIRRHCRAPRVVVVFLRSRRRAVPRTLAESVVNVFYLFFFFFISKHSTLCVNGNYFFSSNMIPYIRIRGRSVIDGHDMNAVPLQNVLSFRWFAVEIYARVCMHQTREKISALKLCGVFYTTVIPLHHLSAL